MHVSIFKVPTILYTAGMVRASFHYLLDVLRLLEDGHCANVAVAWWRFCGFELDRTGLVLVHKQLLESVGILWK